MQEPGFYLWSGNYIPHASTKTQFSQINRYLEKKITLKKKSVALCYIIKLLKHIQAYQMTLPHKLLIITQRTECHSSTRYVMRTSSPAWRPRRWSGKASTKSWLQEWCCFCSLTLTFVIWQGPSVLYPIGRTWGRRDRKETSFRTKALWSVFFPWGNLIHHPLFVWPFPLTVS